MTIEAEAAQEGAPVAPASAQLWLDRLKEAEETFEKWGKQCENLDKLFAKTDKADSADREYSIFWANIEVLRPATYARPPVPVVAPRFKDSNPLAREASETLERALIVSQEQGDVDGLMREVRDEFLRYSRGTAWVRLAGNADRVEYDWVHRPDFLHEPARTWREVTWVAKRAWLTRDQGIQRFGEKFRGVPLRKKDPNAAVPDKGDKAAVWEIWSKADRCVYWVATDHAEVLDHQDAFLDLTGFFPCPKPAYGTLKPGSLVPVPEILQYKDQIEEINEYTARIAALSESLRLKGFYAAGAGDISEAIDTAMKSLDNRATLVPISSFAAVGGTSFKDSIVWLPIDQVAQLVTTLVELRRVVIEDVYQITGISDIVRGSTDAGETATAQQIKSQWGSLRIRERQNELIRFARDLTRLAGEIISENFAPGVIFEMAQSQLPDAAQKQQAMMIGQQAQQQQQPIPKEVEKALKLPTREEVAQFLVNDRARGFVIEIETDSTIQPDEDAEKNRRIEFVTAVGGMFQQAAPLVMQAPAMAPLFGETMRFAAAAFRAGRPLESAIDQFVESLEGMAAQAGQAQQPPPDPVAEAKAQAELKRVEIEEARTAHDKEEKDRRFELDRAKAEAEMHFKSREIERADDAHETEKVFKAREVERADDAHVTEKGFKDRDFGLREREVGERSDIERAKLNDVKAARREEAGLTARETPEGEEEVLTVEDARAERTDTVLTQMAEAMNGMAQGFERMGEGFERLAAAQAAPKRVVRGPDGKALGVETVN